MASTLNVELIGFFSALASATDVLGHQGTFMVLALLWLFVALGAIGFMFLFQRKHAHLLLNKIHLAGLFTGRYCFASPAAGLGCWSFQDAAEFGTWQFLAVPDGNGMRLDGFTQATNKCPA